MINRIILSLKNRFFRTILFVVLFFVLSLFLCSSLLIYRSYHQCRKAIVSTLNTQVVIVNRDLSWEKIYESESVSELKQKVESYIQIMDDLRNQEYVKYGDIHYNLTKSNFMTSCHLIDLGNIECVTDSSANTNLGSEYTVERFRELLQKKENAMTYLGGNIKSVKEPRWTLYYKFIEDFVPDTGSRTFTQEEIDSGAFVAILNNKYSFVNENEERPIEVGDVIPISIMIRQEQGIICYETYEFEVIGIIHRTVSGEEDYPIYIPEKAWRKIAGESEAIAKENLPGYYDQFISFIEVSDAYFELDSFDNLENFTNKIQTYRQELNGIEYYTNVDQLLPFVSDLKLIEYQFLFLSLFIILASVILYSLLMYMEQINRRKETMILSYLGEKQGRILGQYWIEYLILGILGSLLAIWVLSMNIQQFFPTFDVADLQTMSDYLNPIAANFDAAISLFDWVSLLGMEIAILSGSFVFASVISAKKIKSKLEE